MLVTCQTKKRAFFIFFIVLFLCGISVFLWKGNFFSRRFPSNHFNERALWSWESSPSKIREGILHRSFKVCGNRWHTTVNEILNQRREFFLAEKKGDINFLPPGASFRCWENTAREETQEDELCGGKSILRLTLSVACALTYIYIYFFFFCIFFFFVNYKGLGDRFVGVVSTFMMALLSKRFFFMEWPMSQYAFLPSSFNWVLPEEYSSRVREVSRETRLNLINGQCPLDHEDPNTLSASSILYTIKSNRGCIGRAFDANASKVWQTRRSLLEKMGLKDDTAFGCMLNSLVAPNDKVIERSRTVLHSLLDPSVFTIGIHIRLGDAQMALGSEVDIALFDAYWTAAERLGRQRADFGQDVKWLLVTDSLSLKKQFLERFGSTALLTDVDPFHVSKHDVAQGGVKGQWGAIPHTPEEAVMGSFMEWWLLSLCDSFVLNAHSSFSRTAAAFSLRPGSIYVLNRDLPEEGQLLRTQGIEAFLGLGNGL